MRQLFLEASIRGLKVEAYHRQSEEAVTDYVLFDPDRVVRILQTAFVYSWHLTEQKPRPPFFLCY